jgi:glyoxylase-like metal-dependent hydrolase (beta-lactamase superfamily II)
MKLHVLDLGQIRMESKVLIGAGPSPFPEQVEVPVSAYCIDHPEGRILFDVGCHPQAMGPNGRWSPAFQRDYPHLGGEECTLPHRLEQMGLGPDDFRTVVLSHLHSDHAGCVEFFLKSQLIVHAEELKAAKYAHLQNDGSAYAVRDIDAWLKRDLDWRLIAESDGDRELASGVTILNLGSGHAFGMLALSVDLAETGKVVLASDAVYCAENLEGQLPSWVVDPHHYRRTVKRLRGISVNAQIWFGHDPRQFATLRKSTEGWYE